MGEDVRGAFRRSSHLVDYTYTLSLVITNSHPRLVRSLIPCSPSVTRLTITLPHLRPYSSPRCISFAPSHHPYTVFRLRLLLFVAVAVAGRWSIPSRERNV